jgi:transposase InsO family protein
MKLHANAPCGPKGRLTMVGRVVDHGWSLAEAAEAAGVSERTCSKWVGRYRREGEAGLVDRSSAPARVPHRTPEDRVQAIAALRRLRMTAAEIGELLAMPLSTTSAILKRIGLGKRSRLEPPEPSNRYERSAPGELVHVDVKKLARFHRPGHRMLGRGPGRYDERQVGYDYVHVCVDDYSRMAYAEVLPNERATTAIAFLRRATQWFADRGVEVQAVMSDNGSAYRSKLHKVACIALGIRHLRTKPRRPRTNGKAERFIQTMLGGWAYGRIYRDSNERNRALSGWLTHYNYTRRHGSLGHKPPSSRLNNLARNYI